MSVDPVSRAATMHDPLVQDALTKADARECAAATITPYEDGPLIVRGAFRLVDVDGTPIDPGRTTIALCRCGRSGSKPFCDGSHKLAGFTASSGPSRPRPAARLRADE